MRSLRKCLFLALFCALWAFSGIAAFADCEANLSHGFAKVTAKLLREGVLTLEEIKVAAESDQPVNPLRHHTPGSRDANAIQFFYYLLTQKSTTDTWAAIRAELRGILANAGVRAEEVNGAREETAIILAPTELSLPEIKLADFYGTWQTSDGRALYAFKAGKKIEVRDLSRRDWSWSSPEMDSWTLAGLSEDADGKVRLNVVRSVSQGFFNKVAHNMKLRYQRDSWDIAGGEDRVETFYFKGNIVAGSYFGSRGHADAIVSTYQIALLDKKAVTFASEDSRVDSKMGVLQPDGTLVLRPTKFASGEAAPFSYSFLRMDNGKAVDIRHRGEFKEHSFNNYIDYLFTRDGRKFSAAYYTADKTRSHIVSVIDGVRDMIKPEGAVGAVKLWQAASGRVYLGAWVRVGDVHFLQIYEPAVSVEKPVYELKLPPGMTWDIQIDFFEFRERLYVVAAARGDVHIFEPEGGSNSVMHFSIGNRWRFQLYQSKNQVFLIPQTGKTFEAYGLFTTEN